MSDALPVEIAQHYPLPLTQLPAGWERVWLADIASSISPGFASGKHSSDGKGVPHLRPMNVDRDGQIDLAIVKSVASSEDVELAAGDVLFNNTNSPELVGKTALVSEREAGFAYSNHMTRIRLEPGVVPAFVARQLHFLWMSGYLKTRCTNHVNQASISSTTLASTVPLMLAPTAEQERIVEVLDTVLSQLDDGVKELRSAERKSTTYRHALTLAAMDGALTRDWREYKAQHGEVRETGLQLLERILRERRDQWRLNQIAKYEERGRPPPLGWQDKYPEPASIDTTKLPAIPATWTWASIEQICPDELSNGRSVPSSEIGAKVLRLNALKDGRVDLREHKRGAWTEEEARPYAVAEGDLLIARGNGSLSLVGRAGLVARVTELIAYPDTMIRLRVVNAVVRPAWIRLLWDTATVRSHLERRARTSAGIYKISQPDIMSVVVPIPPLAEQDQILGEIDRCDQQLRLSQSAIQASVKRSRRQRENILRTAFSGQLVSQVSEDEPAIELLKRINAARAQMAAQPRTRKSRTTKEAKSMVRKLVEVLADSVEWLPAQEAFRRCGIEDGAETDQVEALYAELRALDKSNRLAIEAVTDAQGRKLYDRLRLLPAD